MKTIYKYEIETDDFFYIDMPIGAEILTVQIQYGIPYIWVKVDIHNPKKTYAFRTFGTGHPIEEEFDGKYIGTYQLNESTFIFHLYLTN